jgi:hypothetical protein
MIVTQPKLERPHNQSEPSVATALLRFASSETGTYVLCQIGWNSCPPVFKLAATHCAGKSKRGVHDPGVEAQKVLRHCAGSSVARVERCHHDGFLAGIVELPVHAALGEHGRFEPVQRAGDLLVLARLHEPVLKYATELEIGALDEDEELRSPGVDVGCIDAAGLEKDHRHAGFEASGERIGRGILHRRAR